jgi:hypothetical protein
LEALADSPSRLWQNGELLSRKTVAVGRTFLKNQYVYRVRGFNCWYLVVADAPLQLGLYTPMKFFTFRKQLVIQDSDGNEWKAHILQKAASSHGR